MNVEALIQSAIDKSATPYTPEEVDESVKTGFATLFHGEKSVMILTVQEHADNSRSVHCWLSAGDMDEIINELRPKAEKWAKDECGCSRVTIEGRDGWERVLKKHGYAKEAVVLGKAL